MTLRQPDLYKLKSTINGPVFDPLCPLIPKLTRYLQPMFLLQASLRLEELVCVKRSINCDIRCYGLERCGDESRLGG